MKRDRMSWSSPNKPEFDYIPTRDLKIALTEYAPGRELTIDKKRFSSASLYSPYVISLTDVLDESSHYVACDKCGYVQVDRCKIDIADCPVCDNDELFHQRFVVPPGFAVDVNERPKRDEGGSVQWAGFATQAQLEMQNVHHWSTRLFTNEKSGVSRLTAIAKPRYLVVVNKGIDDRGFAICPDCGLTEPEFGKGFTKSRLYDRLSQPKVHKHPTQQGAACLGQAKRPFYLGYRFRTDVALLRLTFEDPFICSVSEPSGHSALTTLSEALCLAASRVLSIEDGEIQAGWSPVSQQNGQQAEIFIYDHLAGGAGYAREIGTPDRLHKIFAVAEKLLSECTCEYSCYSCLRHYANQHDHGILDRYLALALLRHIVRGEVPIYEPHKIQKLLDPLCAVLDMQDRRYRRNVKLPDPEVSVPLILLLQDRREEWIDIHHPLVQFSTQTSPVWQAGTMSMEMVTGLSGYDLQRNLPAAIGKLETHLAKN